MSDNLVNPSHTPEQVQAAMEESREYARINKLFPCLDLEEVAAYHWKKIEEEYEQLSPEEKSLSPGNLKLLEIPPITITEEWVVPKRIVDIIEKVSHWPTDEELLDLQDKLWDVPNGEQFKLELPLLQSSHEGDCAEHEHMVSSFKKDLERLVFKPEFSPDIEGVLSAAKEEEEFARNLDASIASETMEVSQKTVQIIQDVAKGMEWTDETWAQMVDELMADTPILPSYYISPPLLPVPLPRERILPDGGACLVSEASELSSRVSQDLAEAEKALYNKTDVWPTYISVDCVPGRESSEKDDDEWPMETLNSLLEEWPLDPCPPGEQTPIVAGVDPDNSPATLSGADVDPELEDSLLNLPCEDVTTETLFDTGDNAARIAQVKLPVPKLHMDIESTPWKGMTDTMQEMFQRIKEDNKEAFDSFHWSDNEEESMAMLEKRIFDHEGEDIFPEGPSRFEDLAIFSTLSEEDYEQREVFDIEQPLGEPPVWSREGASSAEECSWDKLISRQKRRKKGKETSPKNQENQENREPASFKAPELRFGIDAFAKTDREQTCQTEEREREVQTQQADDPIPMAADTSQCPPVNTSGRLGKVVLSMTVPRAIRTQLLQVLPGLEFVERDYDESKRAGKNIEEADISSCSAGIVMATMVTLRQSGSGQNVSVFQQRIATLSEKYERLHVLVYRSQELGLDGDSLPELSPSDALAFTRLQGFACSLPRDVSVMYICGGEHFVGRWTASFLSRSQGTDETRHERFLAEAETPQETFLCQAGLNVYDAQVVLGLLREETSRPGPSGMAEFVAMSREERNRRFGPHVGCRWALERVNGRI